ncbi:ATP-grasp domain-containing protein [Flexibacterium corallicola]|uniref:ATP-grasp domain-containing protein n=1 Tax=Flexibacterium corallicola TaxID=3037259 RepID=UPI00286F4BD6|nr:ATP-grasp domain-containing protein [Pseudovibrio sp. M1P-2-3]
MLENNHTVHPQANYAEDKTILILGAGPDQYPLYQRAKEAGARIIGADANAASLARDLTDQFLHIKTRRAEEILELLAGEKIDGVASPGNDSFHQTIFDLAKQLELPHTLSSAAVRASMDKGYFSDKAKEIGLFSPQHCQSRKLCKLEEFAKKARFPLIAKPSDASGSKGLSFLDCIQELPVGFEKAASLSPTHTVIAEEYIPGDQFGVETFFYKGQCILLAVSKRGHTGAPDFLVTHHHMSKDLTSSIESELRLAVNAIAKELGITDGPINFDVIKPHSGPLCFLEMGARLSGNGFPQLVRQVFGVDTYEWTLQTALGLLLPDATGALAPKQSGLLKILSANKTGVFDGVRGLEHFRKEPAFRDLHLFVSKGDQVRPFKKTIDRLGTVLLSHEDPELIEQALRVLEKNISFEISETNSIIEAVS